MSLKLLPDSSLTSMVMGNDIYAYAQTYEGDIYQFFGNVNNSLAFIRSKKKSIVIIERLQDDKPKNDAPKLFTPIAAVSFTDNLRQPKTERYVFYLNDENILHDQYSSGIGDYQHGTLANKRIQCAHYSSLVAATIEGDVMGRFAGLHRTWNHCRANHTDPLLHGTSLTAVPPRAGILGRSNNDRANERQPIYYLQMDTNAVGSGQGTAKPLPLSGYDRDGLPLAFSPHTSLTAVDNGTHLHLIYKSHTGQVKVIRIAPAAGLQLPELFFNDLDVAPRSSIAACIAPNTGANTCIVLFYQALDPKSRNVQMAAKVVYSVREGGS